MRTVSKIEAKTPTMPTRKRVAAYARVSEEKGRTLHSLSAQVSYYSAFIQKHPEWEYVGVYADSGMTGTSSDRDEFQRLLADCNAGRIDIVLVKSISRFARNTVDLLETVRHLRDICVEVRFEKERINSLSGDGELMLSILASFAQEESRSTSENVKWAIRKGFKEGRGNQFCLYGYHWDGNEYHIVPEEAEIVRLIFSNFLNGLSAEQTEKQLDAMGVKSYTGGHFGNQSIRQILRQERYTGNTLFQKTYIENHITHKSKINHGELPMYYAENTHPAIISKEDYDAVQEEMARRRELGAHANPAINTTCLSGTIKCGVCGRSYVKSTRKAGKDRHPYTVWECTSKKGRATKSCKVKDVPDIILKKLCSEVLGTADFDERAFTTRIAKIIVSGETELTFIFRDGAEIVRTWESTAKKDWWTKERRAAWSEYQQNTPAIDHPFSCRIKCGVCGANLKRDTHTVSDGGKSMFWRCPHAATCKTKSINEDALLSITADVLGLDDFDRDVYEDQILRIINDSGKTVTFHFKDGRAETREFKYKRKMPPWSEERRQRYNEAMERKKEAKTDE